MHAILKHYLSSKYFRKFKNRTDFEIWQHLQVVDHIKKVVPHSTFYSQLFQGLDSKNWRNFPIIDKKIMMEQFDDLNTVGIKKEAAFRLAMEAERTRQFFPKIGTISLALSSGTSGNRGLFLISPEEQAEWAGAIMAKALPKSILSKENIALFMRTNNNLYEGVRTSNIQFQFYNLLLPLETHLEQLNRNPPTILAAPPSLLRLLCQHIPQGRLRITPNKIIALGEVLDPVDEIFIQETFKQKVHQIYQCDEGLLGTTCSFGTMHLNEDVVAVQKEFIDKDAGKFIPVITDFRKKSQPIIRYRLNDILTERRNACPCGSCFIAIEKVERRRDDVFYLPSLIHPNEFIPVFSDHIRAAVIDASNEIEEFFVAQRDANCMEISVKTKSIWCLEELIRTSLQQLCLKLQCKLPYIHFSSFEENKGEKKPRVA